MAAESPSRGLEARYEVTKINDPRGKHRDCRYFVLDPQHDELARRALKTYAIDARIAGNIQLSKDLLDWLDDIERLDQEDLQRRFRELSERVRRASDE